MARLRRLLFFFALLLGIVACQKVGPISQGVLPPGEPSDDNNTPATSSGVTSVSDGSGGGSAGDTGSRSESSGITTHLPPARHTTHHATTASARGLK